MPAELGPKDRIDDIVGNIPGMQVLKPGDDISAFNEQLHLNNKKQAAEQTAMQKQGLNDFLTERKRDAEFATKRVGMAEAHKLAANKQLTDKQPDAALKQYLTAIWMLQGGNAPVSQGAPVPKKQAAQQWRR